MDEPKMSREDFWNDCLKTINENISLQSWLYDLDRLPEQLERGSTEWRQMCCIVVGFQLGLEVGREQ